MAGWDTPASWGTSLYDPASAYGGTKYQPGEYAQTPYGSEYMDQNPEVAWTRALAALGIDPGSAKGQFAAGMWPKVLDGYKAATLTNPNLRIQDYVATLNPNAMYQNQTTQERGETPQAFSTRARTIGRAFGGT